MRFCARLAFWVALVAAVGLAAAAAAFPSRTLDLLERSAEKRRASLGRRLAAKHGLVFFSSMDAGVPADVATGKTLAGAGAPVVPGCRREARRFEPGRKDSLAETTFLWRSLRARGGTLFLWIDVDDSPVEGRIAWTGDHQTVAGLRLRPDRTLEAVFADEAGTHVLSAPFPPAGRFVPVGFAFGPERASLWIDGREAATASVSPPLRLPPYPLAFGAPVHCTASFALDEVSVWNRPLAADELSRLSASAESPVTRLESWRTFEAEFLASASRGFRVVLRVADRIRPALRGAAAFNREVPELEIGLSGRDARHFLAEHERSLREGRRTAAAADWRRISVLRNGVERFAELSLDDAYSDPCLPGGEPACRRPSYLLRGEAGCFAPGSGLARLYPPERHGTVHPEAAGAVPPTADNLVRLVSGGRFLGLYVLEPFDRTGGAWRVSGPRRTLRPDHLLWNSPPGPGEAASGSPEVAALIRTDPAFPWSAAETRRRDRVHAEERAKAGFAETPAVAERDLLGNNPAAFWIEGDLDLSAAGPDVSWRSSDPGAIDAAGRVVRPAGDLPRVVELSGTFPGGTTRTFRFRVVPAAPRLPALFIHVGAPVRKDRRTDFTCVRIPAGGGAPEKLLGTAATGGGLRHRGAVSFVKGSKRALSLEFDRPVGWAGAPAPTDHVALLSGYADATRLRNAFAFDAFARLRPPVGDGPSAGPVSWTELFVNGEYAGVWETVPRVKDTAGPACDALYKVRDARSLWKDGRDERIDRVDDVPSGEDPFAPYREAVRFVSGSDDLPFADRVFDLDELAAFLLLVNFTGNEDGRVNNQYLARRRSDGRWLVLPWDYDKAFRPGSFREFNRMNELFERCLALVPGFRARVAALWADRRRGSLSDGEIVRWFDSRRDFLAPYMEEEYRLVPPAGFKGSFAEGVDAVRDDALRRASTYDGILSGFSKPRKDSAMESADGQRR